MTRQGDNPARSAMPRRSALFGIAVGGGSLLAACGNGDGSDTQTHPDADTPTHPADTQPCPDAATQTCPDGSPVEAGHVSEGGVSECCGPVINVKGRAVTTSQLGYEPTNDPGLGRERLQAFIDDVSSAGVPGIIEAGVWALNDKLTIHDGTELHGEGMQRTIIDCPTDTWVGSKYIAIELDVGSVRNTKGVKLSDFKVIGADKTRSDKGALVRLAGLDDFLVERLWVEDASSYGLFIAGYGVGDFTNDIESEFWNSTFRGVVRQCVGVRGQIAFGTEGGAEGILFEMNSAIGDLDTSGWGLHAFRSASGYNVHYSKNRAVGYRNGFLLDRYRNMHYEGNYIHRCRNGIAMGSFYPSDPEISKDVRIVNNYFNCVPEDGGEPRSINDAFLSNREVRGVIVMGNVVHNGDMLFRQARRLNVTGNTTTQVGPKIITASAATGLVTNNSMPLDNSASGIVDGGNNISV